MDKAIIPRLANGSVRAAIFAVAAIAGSVSALADDAVNTGYFGGVAIMGYDTVAYFTERKAVKGSEEFSYEWLGTPWHFTERKAVKGSEEFSYEWLGTPWHFASKKHQEMFMSEPAKYAPQFGGYCAGEVAGTGSVTINVDPEAFNIIEGKLYLNYDQGTTDWLADNARDALPKAANNWPIVKAKLEVDKPDWNSIYNP